MRKWLAILLLLLPGALLLSQGPAPEKKESASTDAVVIRRRAISLEKVPALLRKYGELVRMKRSELEALIDKAHAARQQPTPPVPELIKATYQAVLVEIPASDKLPTAATDPALKGSGSWDLHVKGPMPQIFPLKPFSLALQATRFANQEARVGNFQESTQGVLITHKSQTTLNLDWSVRGRRVPEGLHFEWRAPAAPIAVLELYLPEGRTVRVSPDDALVLGPFHAEKPELRRWEIHFSGREELYVIVSPPVEKQAEAQGPPLLIRQIRSTHQLHPDAQSCNLEMDIEVRGTASTRLLLPWDTQYPPRKVDAPGLSQWRLITSVGPVRRSQIELLFRQPTRGRFTLKAQTTRKAPGSSLRWRSPIIEFPPNWTAPASGLEEDLEIRFSPELSFENWLPGTFDLQKSITTTQGEYEIQLTRRRPLREDENNPNALAPVRASLGLNQVQYRAELLGHWRIGNLSTRRASQLTTEITCHVERGRLFEVPLLISSGWEVDQIVTLPDGQVQSFTTEPTTTKQHSNALGLWAQKYDKKLQWLTIQLRAPLTSSDATGTAKVRFQIRFLPRELSNVEKRGRRLLFPQCIPLDARHWSFGLGVQGNEQLTQMQFHRLNRPFTAPLDRKSLQGTTALDETDPLPRKSTFWKGSATIHFFLWENQALPAFVHLPLKAPKFLARCRSSFEVPRSGWLTPVDPLKGEVNLEVEVTQGQMKHLDLLVSRRWGKLPWKWEVEEVRGSGARSSTRPIPVTLIPQTAPMTATEAASLIGLATTPTACLQPEVAGNAQRWRMVLARPVLAGSTITLHTNRPVAPFRAGQWLLPVTSVLGAQERETTIQIPRQVTDNKVNHRVELTTRGTPDPSPRDGQWHLSIPETTQGWILARLGDASRVSAPNQPREVAAVIPGAKLITQMSPEEPTRQTHLLTFQIEHWAPSSVMIQIPARPDQNLRLLVARIDGLRAPNITQWISTSPGEPNHVSVEIPLPRAITEKAGHRIELLYETTEKPWSLWTELDRRTPQFPVSPLTFRRIWRLPKDVIPFRDGDLKQWSPPTGSTSDWVKTVGLSSARDWWSWEDPLVQQQAVLDQVDQSLAQLKDAQPWTLAHIVDHLAFQELAPRGRALVIDQPAFQQAGLRPQQLLPEGRRIVTGPDNAFPRLGRTPILIVPTPGAILLTTQTSAQNWPRSESVVHLPSGLVEAIHQTIRHKHDPGGRIYLAQQWLSLFGNASTDGPNVETESLLPVDPTLVEWEEIGPSTHGLVVMSKRIPKLIGWGLAGLLLIVVLVVRARLILLVDRILWWRHHGREEAEPAQRKLDQRLRLWLGLLLIHVGWTGLAWIWLSSTWQPMVILPFLSGSLFALWWYFRPLSIQEKPSVPGSTPSGSRKSVVVGALLALILLSETAPFAALPESAPVTSPETELSAQVVDVYVLGKLLEPEQQQVLAPPALIESLRKQAEDPTHAESKPVIVRVQYLGKVESPTSQTATFDVTVEVYCAEDKPCKIHLPLSAQGKLILTKEVLLDGARAWPQKPEKETKLGGLLIPLKAKGLHKIQLSFTVPLRAVGTRRDVLFQVPRTALAHLSMDLPNGSQWIQAVSRLGSQSVAEDDKGAHLKADLGTGALQPSTQSSGGNPSVPLLVRWFHPTPNPPKPIRFRDAWLWTLEREHHQLSGLVEWDFGSDHISRLAVDLPEDLDLSSVNVRSVDPRNKPLPAEHPRAHLTNWTLMRLPSGEQRLTLMLEAPTTGRAQLTLGLSRRMTRATSRGMVRLEHPVPQGERLFEESFVACDVKGTNAFARQARGLKKIEPQELPEWYVQIRGRPELRSVTFAFQAMQAKQKPGFDLFLKGSPDLHDVDQILTWKVRKEQADFHAEIHVRNDSDPLTLFEYLLPRGTQLESVQGSEIHHWSRTGDRLQIWLKKSLPELHLQIRGNVGISRSRGRDSFPFDVPRLRPLRASTLTTTLQLHAMDNLSLRLKQPFHLDARPEMHSTDRLLTYRSRQQNYRGIFEVQQATLPTANVCSVLSTEPRQLTWEGRIHLYNPKQDLRQVGIQLSRWQGEAPQIQDAPAGTRVEHHQSRTGTEHHWTVYFPPGHRTAQLTLKASREFKPFRLPLLKLNQVTDQRHLIAIQKNRFDLEQARDVKALDELLPIHRLMLKQSNINPDAQKLFVPTREPWLVRVVPREREPVWNNARMLGQEQQLLRSRSQHWLHRSCFQLYLQESTRARIRLPQMHGAPAQLVDVHLDGQRALDKLHPEKDAVYDLALPEGAHQVCLTWRFPTGIEHPDHPQLASPELEGADPTEANWIVHFHETNPLHSSDNRLQVGLHAAVEMELRRAEVQQKLSRLIAPKVSTSASAREQLEQAQKRFHRHCRSAEHWLRLEPGEDKAENSSLREQLQALRQENQEWSTKAGFDALQKHVQQELKRTFVSQSLPNSQLHVVGTPHYMLGSPTGNVTSLDLTGGRKARDRMSMATSCVLGLTLILIWILSRYPGIRGFGRTFWPEHLAVVGLVASQIYGSIWLVLILFALALVGRGTSLLVWLLTPKPQPSRSTFA